MNNKNKAREFTRKKTFHKLRTFINFYAIKRESHQKLSVYGVLIFFVYLRNAQKARDKSSSNVMISATTRQTVVFYSLINSLPLCLVLFVSVLSLQQKQVSGNYLHIKTSFESETESFLRQF